MMEGSTELRHLYAVEYCLWFIACKVVTATIKCCVLTFGGILWSPGMKKGVKYNQDQ